MKRVLEMKRIIGFALMGAWMLSACNNDEGAGNGDFGQTEFQPIELNVTEQAMAEGQTGFAYSLFAALNQNRRGENLLVSPFNLQCALGMLSNGAVGETRDEIVRAMGLDGYPQDEVNAYFQKLIQGMNGVNPYISVQTSNSVWVNQRVTLNEAFWQTSEEKYKALVALLDFEDPSSVNLVNAWCDETTHGKIPKVLDGLFPSIYVYLLNSVYFKARWDTEFSKSQTRQDDFYTGAGNTVRAYFMHQTIERGYVADGEGFTSAVLPYVDGNYEMRFILPDEGVSVDDVADALASSDALREAIDNGGLCRINYAVPRFEMENDITLNGALQALGMKLAFTAEGDLSALTTPYAPVSTIFQVATLTVDEEGSEGAAVTAVTDGAAPPDETLKEVDFTLNRPFLFLITETGTGTVLFMGKVENPA